MEKNYIIAVDLGSANVTVAVGEKIAGGKIDILYATRKPVEGVTLGQIENIDDVGKALEAVIRETEAAFGCRINEAYAGISGEFVRCTSYQDYVHVTRPNEGISKEDMDSLYARMRNVQAPEGEIIMERTPLNFIVDQTHEVKNPVGSFGHQLASTFNFILCLKTPIERLKLVLRRCEIALKDVIPNVLAIPESVISEEEKLEGVAVVDIGAGLTDVTVYHGNKVRHIASIPLGAAQINEDIRSMGVPDKYVEQLKIEKGCALASEVHKTRIKVPGRTPREEKMVLSENLAKAIEARLMDIAEYVQNEIRLSRYESKLAYGVVLTGGSSKLPEIDKLFRKVLNMDVRIGTPENITERSQDWVGDPAYATVTGLLLRGATYGSTMISVSRIPQSPSQKAAEAAAAEAAAQAQAQAQAAAAAAAAQAQAAAEIAARAAAQAAAAQAAAQAHSTGVPVSNTTTTPTSPIVTPAPTPVPTPNPAPVVPTEPEKPKQPAEESATAEEPKPIEKQEQPGIVEVAPEKEEIKEQEDDKTDTYIDDEIGQRAEERAGRMKSRVSQFFDRINSFWDRNSRSDSDDDEV